MAFTNPFRTLFRRPERAAHARPILHVLSTLPLLAYLHFFSGWLAWTCDAVDFFSVTLSVEALSKQFNDKPTHDITTAITLTLLFRSVGAVIMGLISDRYGRRWPLVANLVLVAVLELVAGFVNTFRQFLALRSLFGIGMGGIWGMASSTALENLPVELRGLASGILQQGYAVGYLLAACINLRLVPETDEGWRSLFWCAAGMSGFAAVVRAVLPESEVFLRARERKEKTEEHKSAAEKTKIFWHELREMLKRHWVLSIYAVMLMTGFNFLSHGSQDLYPTYLKKTKLFSDHQATIATIIGNCGAVAGGAVAGFSSQYIGRRLTIILCIMLVGAFIPLWILPSTFSSLSAGAFCVQFGVQGAWGIVPVFLSEMSPPAFRATFPGVAYQLGNMVSSASAQIEATGGDHIRTSVTHPDGTVESLPDYASVMGILVGVVAVWTAAWALVGPENLGAHFERHKTAFEKGAVEDERVEMDQDERGSSGSDNLQRDRSSSVDEKHSIERGEEIVDNSGNEKREIV